MLERAAERGEPLSAITAALLRLLDQYGTEEFTAAVAEALERGVPHTNAVRLALERQREQRGAPPPLALPLSDAVRRRDPVVRTHTLTGYDQLTQKPNA